MKITSSGTLTFNKPIKITELFIVGGGGVVLGHFGSLGWFHDVTVSINPLQENLLRVVVIIVCHRLETPVGARLRKVWRKVRASSYFQERPGTIVFCNRHVSCTDLHS